VLVTGCSSGIGQAAAIGLAARGFRVFATARAPAAVATLAGLGLESLELDVSDSGSIDHAVRAVLDRTGGRLYGLFNNAGYGQPGAVEDLTREALREQFETNLFGAHELTCRVLPAMRARGEGRIIQNSSLLGYVALRYRGAYVASKHALEGLTDALRLELADSGVEVSLIEPGPIASRFRENALAAYRRHLRPEASVHREAYRRIEGRLTTRWAPNWRVWRAWCYIPVWSDRARAARRSAVGMTGRGSDARTSVSDAEVPSAIPRVRWRTASDPLRRGP
jgi:NAD(P)-dependent dehydrogenase (short-subunit alcohol dehydrogenase family)